MRQITLKVVLVFKKYADDELSSLAQVILANMTDNADFANTFAVVNELRVELPVYMALLISSAGGDRELIARKNQAKNNINKILERMAGFINAVALNDRAKLLSTGFPITQEAVAKGPFAPNPLVSANYIGSGRMTIVVKEVSGQAGVIYQFALQGSVHEVTGEPSWVTTPNDKLSCVMENLPVGKTVLIRVGVWDSKGTVIYSEPLVRLVA